MSPNKVKCAGCQNVILDRRFLSCALCEKKYDLLCANIPEPRVFAAMTNEHRRTWKCALCLSRKPKSQNDNTPVRGDNLNVTIRRGGPLQSHPGGAVDRTSGMSDEMDVSFSVGGEPPSGSREQGVSAPTDLQLLVAEMRLIRQEMQVMNKNMCDLSLAVSDLSTRLDACDRRVDSVIAHVDELQRRVDQESESSLAGTVAQLKAELNDRDQELLLNQLEVTGVPEPKGENPVSTTIILAQKIGVALMEGDVMSAVRVGRGPDLDGGEVSSRSRPLVITLTRCALRDQLLHAARVRRGASTEDTGLPTPHRRFYVNERLTRYNRFIFNKARELKMRYNWRFVWTKQGRIYARQHPGSDSPRHRIRAESDLSRVFGVPIV
jgi:hypothetical protein